MFLQNKMQKNIKLVDSQQPYKCHEIVNEMSSFFIVIYLRVLCNFQQEIPVFALAVIH